MIWEQIACGLAYLIVVGALLLVLLPKLIEALTWDTDFPEYGKWTSSDWYIGADISGGRDDN